MKDDDLELPDVMPLSDVVKDGKVVTRGAATRLGCSVRTLERARLAGDLVASQLAERGCWVVTRDDLLAFVASRRKTDERRPIVPTSGADREAARVALDLRHRSSAGPLRVTDDMGRAA